MSDIHNYVQFKDWMTATARDKYGQIKGVHVGEDLITNAGMAAVAGLILKDITTISGFEYVAIGSDNTGAAAGNTVLAGEFKRAAGTGTRITTTQTNDTAQLVYIFASGKPAGLNGTSTGSQAIDESGVFNSPAEGNLELLCRQTFGALNIDWDGGDSLQITWKVQVS